MLASDHLPLAGLRVVDSADEKAELGGRLLADLGADVVRIEPPGGGVSRRLGPFHDGVSLHFAVRNTNKRTLTLDVTDATDRDALDALLASADIWLDTSRPGQLASLGLAETDVVARHPHLVLVSTTDFGQTGPYRDFVATDAVLEAMGWMVHRAGTPDRPPVLPPTPIAYDIAGVVSAWAALTGFRHRQRSGRGQWIDLSVMEAVAQTTDWGLASFSVMERMMPGAFAQVRDGGGKIYPIIACAEGWVRPSMVTKAEWHKMRAWLGEPAELQGEELDTTGPRMAVFDDVLRPRLLELFADMTMVEAAEEGQRRKIPVTPLLRPADVLASDHYREIGTFVETDVAPGLRTTVPSGFYTIDGDRVGVRQPAVPVASGDESPWCSEVRLADDRPRDDELPFQGVRVLDFGIAGAAPEIARLLAEYGADVIRVEIPSRPDLFRQLGGPNGIGPVFASSSRTKRSIGIALDDPEGLALAKRLIAISDIVVENLPPGTMDRFGLGHDAVRAANPSALMISTQTMGLRGPWRDWRGYGANTQPPTGLTYLWSYPDAVEPVGSNVAMPDHIVGRLGAVIAAAHVVSGSSTGHVVEIVQAEVVVNLLAELMVKQALEPGSVAPRGNDSDRGVPWGMYPAAGEQRWVAITCRDDADWAHLVAAIGDNEWVTPEMATSEGRRRAQQVIDERLAAWTADRADRDVMALLQAKQVPCGYMMYIADTTSDPHMVARGYLIEIDQPGLGPMLFEGAAFRSDALPAPRTQPAPFLGEHTIDVARQLLGLDDDEVARLLESGALHQHLGEAAA